MVISYKAFACLFLKYIFAILFFGAFSMHAFSNTSQKDEWRIQAYADLEFIHQVITDSHPGVLEEKDVAFQTWYKQGYIEARQLLAQAKTAKQALAALHYYAIGYQDSHLNIMSSKAVEMAFWAGWIMQKRGNDFVVTEVANHWPIAVPPVGARVLSCDGMLITQYIEINIAPYTDRRNLYQSWQRNAMRVTLDSPIEWPLWHESRAQECMIQLSNGRQQAYPLLWQSYDENLSKIERFYTRKKYPLQVEQLDTDAFWIYASSFDLKSKQQLAFEEMLLAIRQLSKAQLVVLDTRGNKGGNSLVGLRILKALLKERFIETESNATAHFRISDLAINTFKKALEHYRKIHGESSIEFRVVDKQYQGMQAAQLSGKDWFQQDSSGLQENIVETGKPFNGQLVLLTDSSCVSACLNFADMALGLPNTIHMGLPTNADTNYLEVASLKTPSGLSITIPIKVWRNRSRASNQAYIPEHLFAGDISDTAAVQQWVLETLKY